MGAYAPVPHLEKFYKAAVKEVLDTSLEAIKAEKKTFRGFLFCGLMISPKGEIFVLEYNVRLGDPEACVLLPLMANAGMNVRDILLQIAKGQLTDKIVLKTDAFSLGTVLASQGYPDAPKPVDGFTLADHADAWWCHAGTLAKAEETLTHKGGRIACAVSLADSLEKAQQASLALVQESATAEMIYRRDIGYRAISKKA
jgi:phosphoribosylamine--glycine ligase